MKLYFLLIICLAEHALGAVPAYFKICGRQDPKLNECIVKSVNGLREQLRNGIPELDVPSIEPLTVDEIVLANDASFRAVAQKVKFYGFPDFQVKGLKVDLENQRFDIDVAFPKVRLEAEYDVATRVVVPIAGKGPINIVAEDVTAKVTLKYRLVERKGSKYLFFPTMTTKLAIGDYTSHFVPREGSDGALAGGINAALMEDRQGIIETITPNLEKAISLRTLPFANMICKHFTYDELFPDRI